MDAIAGKIEGETVAICCLSLSLSLPFRTSKNAIHPLSELTKDRRTAKTEALDRGFEGCKQQKKEETEATQSTTK